MISIPLERITDIIIAARACEAEERDLLDTMHARGGAMEDDDDHDNGYAVTPARGQLLKLIVALRGAQFTELLALAWLGRGDFEPEALPDAVRQASNIISTDPAHYLANLPGLADYLESALISIGVGVGN